MTTASHLSVDGAFEALVTQLEERLRTDRSYGRPVDLALRELLHVAPATWPSEPTAALSMVARIMTLGAAWLARAANRSRALEMLGELCLVQLTSALEDLPTDTSDARVEEALLSTWTHAVLVPRELVARLIADHAPPPIRSALIKQVRGAHFRASGDLDPLSVRRRAAGELPSIHQHIVLRALLQHATGAPDEALQLLRTEGGHDPACLEALADVLEASGHPEEAIETLHSLIGASALPQRQRARERLAYALQRHGRVEDAFRQWWMLLEETGDLLYWNLLCDEFPEEERRLQEGRTLLRDRFPHIAVDIAISEGDLDTVRALQEGRNFSPEQLWRMGDFLASVEPRNAAGVYERAIHLQARAAQQRGECVALADRIARVLPFYQSLQRPTRPRRIAREALSTAANPEALRKELERVFEIPF